MKVKLAILTVGLWLGASSNASAIIIRDDVADAEYVVPDEQWPALVDLFEPGDCIGTLVAPDALLTVAHCATDLRVGDALEVDGDTHVVREVVLHPQWPNPAEEFDIAIVLLETSVSGVEPFPIYRGDDELDAEITLVGRGITATAAQGEAMGSVDGQLRRATNVVNFVEPHFLEVTMDAPSDPAVTALEGVGASGDSGCPAFIVVDGELQIAGVNSFGDFDGDSDIGRYGAFDYQSRVSRYADWIDEVLDADAESSGSTGSSDVMSGADDDGSQDGCGCRQSSPSTLALTLGLLLCAPRRRALRP